MTCLIIILGLEQYMLILPLVAGASSEFLGVCSACAYHHPEDVQAAVVVLARHHHGLPQHVHRSRGALQPASVAHGISV